MKYGINKSNNWTVYMQKRKGISSRKSGSCRVGKVNCF